MSAETLVVEFEVAVPPAQAFDAWTRRCATWWPPGHTISGGPASIMFEPRSGGRIVERAPDGVEHPWGTVLDWQPPSRLRYRWHLFLDASEATEVEITFTARDAHTAVRLEQRGWERLGEAGPPRRDRTRQAWDAITARFVAAL
jgi:uncharacterized protein YndB with AHSA1/START domain